MDAQSVTQIGWDTHRKFSNVTARDANHRILFRRRIEHQDRATMRQILQFWPSARKTETTRTRGWRPQSTTGSSPPVWDRTRKRVDLNYV